MLLQQKSDIKLWGWASKNEKIKITCNWLKESIYINANNEGKWIISVKTISYGGPYRIIFEGENKIEVEDIFFGEVWLSSGQSNMQYPLNKSFGSQKKDTSARLEIQSANYPLIRFYIMNSEHASSPQEDCKGKWISCSPNTVGDFSAVSYYFSKELYNKIKTPVGIICAIWGGSPIESWIRKGYIDTIKNVKELFDKSNQPAHYLPGYLYNILINPLLNYYIKGVIWYQGETNLHNPQNYQMFFEKLIYNWRKDFSLGEFPFYYVQLPPFNYGELLGAAIIREAQLKTMRIANTGMVVTADIGDINSIHPKNKYDVGKRLAYCALNKTYNNSDFYLSGPIYKSYKNENDKIRIFFDYAESGLCIKENTDNSFFISGRNKKFISAKIRIENNSILVYNEEIKKPESVRYAFSNTAIGCLFNNKGLPASPFRTDEWIINTKKIKIASEFTKDKKALNLRLSCDDPKANILFSFSKENDEDLIMYKSPSVLKKSCMIFARAAIGNNLSEEFFKTKFIISKSFAKNIEIINPLDSKISTPNPVALVDGLKGNYDYQNGLWQSLEEKDFICVIDFGKIVDISSVSIGFMQYINLWAFYPEFIEIGSSLDKKQFYPIEKIRNNIPLNKEGINIKDFSVKFKKIRTRYIAIRAKNISRCPEWHTGAGGNAYLFIDEISIF